MGLRASDKWCVPLTRYEHDRVHMIPTKHEEAWFRAKGVDSRKLALELWEATGDLEKMKLIVAKHLKVRLRFMTAQRAAQMRAKRGDSV